MKNLKKLQSILIPAIVITSVASCRIIREHGYVVDYILVNSSGRILNLLKYGNGGCDTAVIDSGTEYTFFRCSGDMGYGTAGDCIHDFNENMKDSVVIWFDDGKKIIYKPLPVAFDSVINIKNIYNLYNHYEQIEIDTGDKYHHHNEERYHITPEDYTLTK